MIILLILVFMGLSFVSFIYVKKLVLRGILSGIFLIALILSVWGLTANYYKYFGMKEVTSVKSQAIYTAGDVKNPFGVLVYTPLGDKSDNDVLTYRTDKMAAKPTNFFVLDTNHLAKSTRLTATYQLTENSTAKAETKITRRVFTSNLMKLLFGIGNENEEIVKQRTIAYIPSKTWLVLNQAQAKKLEDSASLLAANEKKELAANPEKAVELAQLQKTDPAAYAAFQVRQIKIFLSIK